MSDKNECEQLLEKVNLLRSKDDQVLKGSLYDFNIFTILRRANDEVNLHSRFLSELLNPNGSHQQQEAFLALFLQQLEIPEEEFSPQNAYLRREYKNIDLLITTPTQALIIENKIYAGDQPHQLERYYKTLKNEGFRQILIVYLTLDGHDPSIDSASNLVDSNIIKTASYADDIVAWLSACIQVVALNPTIREIIFQYQTLVKKLTGQSISKGYIMEIKDLLLEANNFQLALDIRDAATEIMIEVQFKFWEELEAALLNKGYNIVENSKYSWEKVRKFYQDSRNNRWYGLMIDLGELNQRDCLYFYIEIYQGIYYGFTISRAGNRNIARESQFNDRG